MQLWNADCDAPASVRRASMTGSMESLDDTGSCEGTPHSSINTDDISHDDVRSLEKEVKKKKQKKKDKEKDRTKLDENDAYSGKKKKKKVKKKELGGVGASAHSPETTPHKEPLSDRLRASDEYSESEYVMDEDPQFDDFCLKRRESQAEQSAHADHDDANGFGNWDAFLLACTSMDSQHDKAPPHNEDVCQVQHSSKAKGKVMGHEHTTATMKPPPPPVSTIDVDGYEEDVSTVGAGRPEYGGDVLQSILHRISNHNDQQLALKTAMLFEEFMKQQEKLYAARLPDMDGTQGSNSTPPGSKHSSDSDLTSKAEFFWEDFSGKVERMIDENRDGDSFANDWDEGSFATFLDSNLVIHPADLGVQITQPSQDEGWSKIRRNETYQRRLGSDHVRQPPQPTAAPRPRNLLATMHQDMVVENNAHYPMAQLGLNHHPNFTSSIKSSSAGPLPTGPPAAMKPQLAENQVGQLGLIHSPGEQQREMGFLVQNMVPHRMGHSAQLGLNRHANYLSPGMSRPIGPPVMTPQLAGNHAAQFGVIRSHSSVLNTGMGLGEKMIIIEPVTSNRQWATNLFTQHFDATFSQKSTSL